MTTQADIRSRLIDTVKDSSGKLVQPDDYDRIITAAISRYSMHRPAVSVADITGNGTHDYALPAGWVDEYSAVRSIEFPVGDVPATMLERDEFEIYQTPTAKKVRLLNAAPAATQSFRVSFTVPRTASTVPDGDIDALVWLAASLACEELANAFAQASSPKLGADSINYESKSNDFASRARRFEALYKNHMGLKGDDSAPAAVAVTDLDVNYPGGRDRLTHSRWSRERR